MSNVKKRLADLREVPSQELAVFGRAVIEDVNETRLPRLPLSEYIQGLGRIHGPNETELHNGEMFRLSQVSQNVDPCRLLWKCSVSYS